MKILQRRMIGCAIVLFCVMVALEQRASAVIVFEFQSKMINPGDNLTLDVFITGDVDPIQLMEVDFNITPTSGPAAGTSLEFIDPFDDAYLSEANYVFFGNSFAQDNVLDAITVNSPDSATVSDETSDFSDVNVDTQVLIARLRLEHIVLGALDGAGDTYEISVDSGSFGFEDSGGGDPMFDESNVGMVTILSAATAVPEPSSFALLALLTGPILMRRRRR